MAVTAEDFLRLDEELLQKTAPSEIEYRTAAARAYYAVMHLVRSELNLNPAKSTHGTIRRRLLSLHPATTPRFLVEAKKEWDGLWDRRHRSDYEIDQNITRETARASVRAARRIFGLK